MGQLTSASYRFANDIERYLEFQLQEVNKHQIQAVTNTDYVNSSEKYKQMVILDWTKTKMFYINKKKVQNVYENKNKNKIT